MRRSFLLFLVVIFTATGCVTSVSVNHRGDTLEFSQTENIFKQRSASREGIKSIKALYRAQTERGGEKNTLRYAIIFSEPQSLKIQILPLNGFYTLGELVTHDNQTIALDYVNKKVVQGEDGKDPLEKIMGLPFETGELMDFILGFPSGVLTNRDESSKDEESFYLYHKREHSTERWNFHQQSIAPKEVHRVRNGVSGLDSVIVQYQEFTSIQGYRIPSRFKIIVPGYDIVSEVSLSHIGVNQLIKSGEFYLTIPSDFE